MSCYIVQEADGSRFTLEDNSGFLLLEFCEPGGTEYNPVGDNPVSRARRRREMLELEDEEFLVSFLSSLE